MRVSATPRSPTSSASRPPTRAPACTAPSPDFGRPVMRRRESTLDPAVAAELEALEAALAGEPAAEPELAALVRDVRAEAPAITPEFRARLDRRVERRFERALPRRRWQSLRPLVPAFGVAGCVVAAIVAIALSAGGGTNDGASSSRGGGGATAANPLAKTE